MSRHQSKIMLFGVEVTHEQATKIYKNEMYQGSDLSEVIEMRTNNENFYKDVCSEYDEDPTVAHYIGIVIENMDNKVLDEIGLSKYREIFERESKIVINKYNIESQSALFILTSVF